MIETPTLASGRFALHHELGRGGIGVVFDATDGELDRPVAVKRLRPDRADDSIARERFQREARLTGRLDHPGVVPVYGCGADAEGRPYYVMRRIPGRTLKQAIAAYFASPNRTEAEFRQLLSRFVAVCQTMAYAHSRNVIHRDLKPDNIMLGEFGETLVVDWGLAKRFDESSLVTAALAPDVAPPPTVAGETVEYQEETPPAGDSAQTEAGTVMGTFGYMAPEQAVGAVVGPAADLYSLGATLFHMLTGRAPKPGRGLSHDDWRALQPRPLAAVVRKAMAVQPNERYTTAQEIAAEVERWLAGERVLADREPRRERIGRWIRRHPTTTAIVILLGIVAAAATPTIRWYQERDRAAREQDRIGRALLAATEASDLRMRGKWHEALEKLNEADALNHPDAVQIRLDRFRVYGALSRVQDAKRELAAISVDSGSHAAEVLLWQGDDLVAANRNAEGQALVRRALDLGLPAPLRAYAQSLLVTGAANAERHLLEAVALDPFLVEPQRHLAFVLLVSGKWAEFERQTAFSLERFPNDAGFPMIRAIGYGLHGDAAPARQELDRLKQLVDDKTAQFAQFVVDQCLIISQFMKHWPGHAPQITAAANNLVASIMKQSDGLGTSTGLALHIPASLRQAITIDPSRASMNQLIDLGKRMIADFTRVYPDGLFTLIIASDEKSPHKSEELYMRAMESPSIIPDVQKRAKFGAAMMATMVFMQTGDFNGMRRAVDHIRNRLRDGPLRDDEARTCTEICLALRAMPEARAIVDDQLKRRAGDIGYLAYRTLIDAWEGRWQAAVQTSDIVLKKQPDYLGVRLTRIEARLAAEVFAAGVREPTADMVRKALGEPVEAVIRRANDQASSANPQHQIRRAAHLYALCASAVRDDPVQCEQLLQLAMAHLRRLEGERMFLLEKKYFERVHGFHLLEGNWEYWRIVAE